MDMERILKRLRCGEVRCIKKYGDGLLRLSIHDDWSGHFCFYGNGEKKGVWDFDDKEEFEEILGECE